jgi:hypothetical protein
MKNLITGALRVLNSGEKIIAKDMSDQLVDKSSETYKLKSELEAYKTLVHSMFSGIFNANDFFVYASAWGVEISEYDFVWIIPHIQKHPDAGMDSVLAYIQNVEPIKPYLDEEFLAAIKDLVDRKQEVHSDGDYSEEYSETGPYRTVNID